MAKSVSRSKEFPQFRTRYPVVRELRLPKNQFAPIFLFGEVRMIQRNVIQICLMVAIFFLGFWLGKTSQGRAEEKGRVFELRTYTAGEGKLDDLHARFRNHTTQLFQKHGMTNIGYWMPTDAPLSQNTLIYILAYPSREAAKESWDAFNKDPEWKKVKAESEVNGKLVSKVDSVYLKAADYSPMK